MKLYVDSRHRTAGTNESFVWQIPETVDIPDSQVYIDCVLVPNVFFSATDDNNTIFFLEEVVSSPGGGAVITPRQAVIANGQYNGLTLATAVQASMQAAGAYGSALTVEFDLASSKLKVSLSAPHESQVRIYPDGALDQWNAAQGVYQTDLNNTKSAGKLCGFLGTVSFVASTSLFTLGDSVIDVQRHHCCYIHSDIADPGSSFGCRGQSDVIRRVVVDAVQNSLAIDRHTTSWDNVEVGARSLRSMEFRLADDNGNTVNLQGHHWSFSLVFHDKL